MRPLVLGSLVSAALSIPAWAVGSSSVEGAPELIADSKAVFLGHNASPSSYSLGKGQVTVGNFGIATGITEQITVATSPWLWASYEAANVHLKWTRATKDDSRVGVLVSYFETFGEKSFLKCAGDWEGYLCPNQPSEVVQERRQANPLNYQLMEAIAAVPTRYQFQTVATHLLYSIDSGRRTYHFNLKFSYFFNDDRPYSIRIDPGSDEINGQVDATALLEHRTTETLRFNFEAGILGLNAIVPSGHTGASVAWTSGFWLVQFGASATWMLPNTGSRMFEYLGSSEVRIHTAKDGQYYYGGRYHQTSIHPEFQVQYFF